MRSDFIGRFEAWLNKARTVLIMATMMALLLISAWRLIIGAFHFQPESSGATQLSVASRDLEEVRNRLLLIEQGQRTLGKTLSELQANTSQYASLTPSDRQALNQLVDGHRDLEGRLRGLEDAPRLDITKALAVPMIRKDVDALQDKTKSDLLLIQNELGRLFSLAQWFLGAIVTIALAVVSLILSGRKTVPSKAEEK